jgi:hypothetical protein
MPVLDRTKELISYYKLWLGIFIVTLFTLISWFVTNYESAKLVLVVLDILAVVALSVTIIFIHRTIYKKINELEKM